jgi:WD40-like Beta Propeller Repeat
VQNLLAKSWHKIALGFVACAIIPAFCTQTAAAESVREELIRLQREYGLTFAWTAPRIRRTQPEVRAISFDTRTVVGLENSVGAFEPKGFSLGEYPDLSGIGMCWSHDHTKLTSTMINRFTSSVRFGILDLRSKQTRAIAINVDQRPYVTSQCWSPDDRWLVYQLDGDVRLYDVEKDRAEAIAKGTDPTWSPDGKWIAFRDGETYYAMSPDGSNRKELFRNH